MAKSDNDSKGSGCLLLPPASGSGSIDAGKIPHIEIGAILGENREAVILHNGEAYRLRVTANNKLILTK